MHQSLKCPHVRTQKQPSVATRGIHPPDAALCVVERSNLATLGIGMCGYHFLEKMSWVDAFANSSMILAGMGPLGNLNTDAGKIFAGCYALFCGLIFVTIVTLLLAPLFHRALHKFHLEIQSHGKNS